MGRAPLPQLLEDRPRRTRVAEGGGAHLDGVGSRHDQLDGVPSVGHPPDTDDRSVRMGRPHVEDRPYRDRMDGRTRQAAPRRPRPEDRSAPLDVDGHGQRRVDQGHPLGTGAEGGTGNRRQIGHGGTQLGPPGQARAVFAHRGHDLRGGGGRMGEHGPAVLDVRAAHVHLEGAQARDPGQHRGGPREVVDPLPPDADHGPGAHGHQTRELVPDPDLHSWALQSDAVDHAGRRLVHAWGGIAGPGVDREGLDHHRPERGQRPVGLELVGVPCGAGRGHHRVGEDDRAHGRREIDRSRSGAVTGPVQPVRPHRRPTGGSVHRLLISRGTPAVIGPRADGRPSRRCLPRQLWLPRSWSGRAPGGRGRRPGCGCRRHADPGPGGC